MKRAALVFASLFFLFTSMSFSQSTIDSSYQPLGAHYSWSYTIRAPYDTSNYTENVTGDTIIQNRLYYSIDQFGASIPNFSIRNSSDSVYFYSPADSAEHLLFIFSAPEGTSWDIDTHGDVGLVCSIRTKITLVGKSDIITTPAGVFYDCIHLSHIGTCADAGWLDSWYARGIGRIKLRLTNWFGLTDIVLNSFDLADIPKPYEPIRWHPTVLSESFPNPASLAKNRQTTIRYTLPTSSDVQVILYDALGRKVRTLFAGYKPGGTHEIAFNPASLVSGVYFHRFTFTDIFRMVNLNTRKYSTISEQREEADAYEYRFDAHRARPCRDRRRDDENSPRSRR